MNHFHFLILSASLHWLLGPESARGQNSAFSLTSKRATTVSGQMGYGITPSQRQFMPAYGQLPLYFIENQGQTDGVVDYIVHGNDTTLYFTSSGVTFAVVSRDTSAAHSRLTRGRGLIMDGTLEAQ